LANRSIRRMGGAPLVVALAVAMTATMAFGKDASVVQVNVTKDTGDEIVVQYNLAPFTSEVVMIDGRAHSLISLGKEGEMLVAGAPGLPHVCRSVIIPGDAEMGVRIVDSHYRDVVGIDVAPSKGNLYRTVDPADVPYTFGTWYEQDAFYPGEVATLGEPYVLRDMRGVVVELKPLQYNPKTRTLRFYDQVTVEVFKTGAGQTNVLAPRAPGEVSLAFHNLYQRHFLNYNPAPRYAPLDETGSMLIICYDSWLANMQPLVDHKNSIGIPTTAVGVSTIGNNSTAIKNYIQAAYNAGGLAFVLLVGDAAQVATPTASGGSSDPTYSKLAGSDNYPDIMVGRFSAETSAQVDTQVQRTVEYEQLQMTLQSWFWKGVGIASAQGAGQGDEGQADYVHMDQIRGWLIAHSYTTVDQIYDTNGGTAAMVSSALNAGRGIINYCGHGSTDAWTTTGFSSTHVAALTNDNKLPFIVSVACVNGQFNGYTCFAETWLRSTRNGEPIGAVGAYMSSINQSWAPPMEGQDEFNLLYCAPTPSYRCYGTLCYAGSCSMLDDYGAGTGGGGTEMFDTWHVFGDPSLRVIGTTEATHGLKVTPNENYSATGPIGGPFTPASKSYTLENKNGVPMNYSVAGGQTWVSVVNGTGTIPANSTVSVSVTINGNAGSLNKGSFSDVVNFVNLTDHDGDTAHNVSLTVGGPAYDPVAQNKAVSASMFEPSDIILVATDPNGDPLTYRIESLPPPEKGKLIDPNGGEITSVPYTLANGGWIVRYLPPFAQTVATSFTFTAKDATSRSNVATVTVTVGEGVSGKVYDFPMNTNPNWTKAGTWNFGQPTGGGSHGKDPAGGYTGSNVYGYNLNGDYSNSMTTVRYLTTTSLDCSALTNVELRFRRWLGVEGYPGNDHANIQVSNNGSTWTTIWENGTSTVNDTSWQLVTYSLSAWADHQATVYVRWGMGTTDSSTTFPGWNLDDVEFWGVVNASCSGVIKGDVSGNGVVNGADMQGFVQVLLDPYGQGVEVPEFCAADMNSDGFMTAADIDPFVSKLLNP
jgi:gingipain R